jgi:hypothetical protein
LFLHACGYELVKGPGIPAEVVSTTPGAVSGPVTSLNLPVFKNQSFEPQVSMFFTEAFSEELAVGGLVQINKAGADATLQGTITDVGTTMTSLSGQGLAIQKTVTATVTLTLSQKGNVIRSWTFGDSEPYDVTSINSEDYNKRAALIRMAARIARRFRAQLVPTE